MNIYGDYHLSDDGLRCPECGLVDCECVDEWFNAELAHDAYIESCDRSGA